MKNRTSLFFTTLIVFTVLQSCSVERFVPDDELLYEGASINMVSDTVVDNEALLKSELEATLRPDSNKKFLGMHPGLYFHYKAQREKPGFINKFLNKKMGEEPVYLSDVDTYEMEQILLNRLENRGFFYSNVTSSVEEDTISKEANVDYNVRLLQPYLMQTYQLDNDSLKIYKDIKQDLSESVMKKDMRFDLTAMKVERQRIDTDLKKKGYYNFDAGLLLFEADTNQYDNRRYDLFLRLKKDVPKKSTVPYKIGRVNIFPNYTIGQDSVRQDTVKLADKNFIQKEEFFRPDRLDPFVQIEKGQLYDPDISRNTSRRLGSIGAYKFVNIRYDEIDSTNTDSLGLLEANIFLSPLTKRALRAELQAVTKSNNFAGPSLALTFTNRNLFKGGEVLNVSANFGYEVQLAGGNQSGLSSIQLGLKGDLIYPRMLFPVHINSDFFKYSIPKTKISLGVDYLNRSQLFSLGSVTASFGYTWQANRYITHEINPISLNYVKLSNTTEEFDQILADNPFLQSSFDQQFISGLTYSFTYNGMVDATARHQFFLNATFDTAGNSIDLISGHGAENPQTFLGLEYAQYVKADADFRYHLNLGGDQVIATRLFAGIGIPYGNSDILPYTKLYYSGGPYSVRAFKIRSLGPGTYEGGEDDNSAYFDQTGNLRLEANIEYRFPLINVLKGAVFADAGNIWNTKEGGLEGGKFTSDFINQLGIGAGFGLRVDIQSFVIRLDLAAPLHDPALSKGSQWNFDVQNPVLNFAIGYPF
ncbi:BamA/TamA family outer membrane protein [Leeuwenhoekiella sp. A16]|uniref:translocation and assembly module lipoprotein TamL n=1 Tax=unclassified Leeuwenhoekiella TaxID=2615029 RepID=UPI003A80E9BD